MKQNIILWVSAVIILFVVSYYKTITSDYYPLSGSFGVEGEKVTFKFDKIFRGDGEYPVLIRTDKKGLSGYILWKQAKDSTWNRSNFVSGEGILLTHIPRLSPNSYVEYKAVLIYNDRSFTIPTDRPAKLQFRNKISAAADGLYYFFFFGGLILSIRSGLEFFRGNSKVKALSIFTLIFFALLAFIFSPLRNSYDAGFIRGYLPHPGEIFLLNEIIYFLLWLAGLVVLFIFNKWKYSILISSLLILIFFLLTGYPQ